MKTLMITEKATQEKNWRRALGQTSIEILPASGHLLKLVEPGDDDPAYKAWTDAILRPRQGRYATTIDEYGRGRHRVDPIRQALKTADVVIIATDCDREGQLIGQELLEFFGFRGSVKRAMYSAEDPTTLKAALAAMTDNMNHQSLYDAAVARQQGDQIFNLSMTRIATVSLRPDMSRQVYGIGRVKTPSLGILCRLELEIRNFKPVTFYDIAMSVDTSAGRVKLSHAPRDADRIVDKARTDRIVAAAGVWRGPLKVSKEAKRTPPPRPFDLTSLQIKAGAWGWTPKQTEDVAQSLYDQHSLTTYPRAETRYLPEAFIPDVDTVFRGLMTIPAFSGYPLKAPIIRRGTAGVYCDAELSGKGISHHAIIPNVNAPAASFSRIYATLSDDERRLFELIAKGFLASIGDDHLYDQTVVTATVTHGAGSPDPVAFSAVGRVTTSAGWRAAFGAGDADDDETDEDGAAPAAGSKARPKAPPVVVLPPIVDGAWGTADSAQAKQQETKPPNRLTESSMMGEMKNPGKHVSDPAERKRLEHAKGIGTAATRKDVIPGLIAQKMVEVVEGKLVPTDAGMELYDIIMQAAPELCDVGATARMEMRLDDVQAGKATADQVIAEFADRADRLRSKLIDAGKTRKVTAATTADRTQVKGARFKKAGPASRPAKPGARSNGAAGTVGTGLPIGATRLKVPYDQKDEAKGMGARWSSDASTWYAPQGCDLKKFSAKGWGAEPANKTPGK